MQLRLDPRTLPPREFAVRAIGMIGLAGGALAVLTAILPPPAEGSDLLVIITGSVSMLAGGALLIRRPRLGNAALNALGLLGTFLITLATHEGGPSGGTGANVLLYLWICLYAFYFLSPTYAVFQLGAIGVGYGWLLTSLPVGTNEAITQWLVAICSLAVAGVLAAQVRSNLYRLVTELGRRASVDGLTGLLNRASFEERFAIERARAQRTHDFTCLLSVDVDRFKALNDNLGHPTGDLVLRQVAATIAGRVRRTDVAGRIGGDEFAVLLPGTRHADAVALAEQLRAGVRSVPARDASVSVSIGVAGSPAGLMSFDELWELADASMYEAKKSGGDLVGVDAGTGKPRLQVAELVA